MNIKINLLLKKEQKESLKKIKRIVFSGTFIFLANLVIIGSSIYAYWRILSRQSHILEETVNYYQQQIASLKAVEEKKSFLNAELEQIGKIYSQRVDFVKAVEELERLFAGKLKFDSLTLNTSGEAKIATKQTGEVSFNPSANFPAEISHLQLELIASSSAELEEFVNNLQRLKEQGLTRAMLTSLKRTETGRYEVGLKVEMNRSDERL